MLFWDEGWAQDSDGMFGYCEYEYKGAGDLIRDKPRFAKATHWMPIPEGPK